MTILQVRDAEKLRLITGPPGGKSYSTDADIPRSVGDVQRTGDAFTDWDDGWVYPTLLNGWANYNGSPQHAVARYRRYPGGHCLLQGLVRNGSSVGAVIFTLPVGYRPAQRTIHTHYGGANVCRLNIEGSGNVFLTTGSTVWASIHAEWFADDWAYG